MLFRQCPPPASLCPARGLVSVCPVCRCMREQLAMLKPLLQGLCISPCPGTVTPPQMPAAWQQVQLSPARQQAAPQDAPGSRPASPDAIESPSAGHGLQEAAQIVQPASQTAEPHASRELLAALLASLPALGPESAPGQLQEPAARQAKPQQVLTQLPPS